MATFAVTYSYAHNSDEARGEHRPAHVDFLRSLHAEGVLYMSGPLATEPARALLVFHGLNDDELAARLDADPFAVAGLIAERTITPWNVFFDPRIGSEAAA